jgi:hypothetical protein
MSLVVFGVVHDKVHGVVIRDSSRQCSRGSIRSSASDIRPPVTHRPSSRSSAQYVPEAVWLPQCIRASRRFAEPPCPSRVHTVMRTHSTDLVNFAANYPVPTASSTLSCTTSIQRSAPATHATDLCAPSSVTLRRIREKGSACTIREADRHFEIGYSLLSVGHSRRKINSVVPA